MKAILKSDRKVILDLDPRYGTKISQGKDGSVKFETPAYVDKATGIYYSHKEIEWVEYYGG